MHVTRLCRLHSTLSQLPRSIPATFLRGGTSKGVFLTGDSLPTSPSERDDLFLRIMGSPDPDYARQLDGMGGGISSLSKIVVVEPEAEKSGLMEDAQKAHIRYTFAQIGIKDAVVDYSGNCGNLSSMVGPYALWSGLVSHGKVPVTQGDDGVLRATVRAWNTNTRKLISNTFPVMKTSEARLEPVMNLAEAETAGVPGRASAIALEFLNPGGARTEKLLPTGNTIDLIPVTDTGDSQDACVGASLVDATNPTVFINLKDLQSHHNVDLAAVSSLELLERLRRYGATLMGLNPSAQAQPKISLVEASSSNSSDIMAYTLSMGVLHKAIPMTVGLCLGSAANIPGTIPHTIVMEQRQIRQTGSGRGQNPDPALVRIAHPSGVVDVSADVSINEAKVSIRSASVIRTGKRLMTGNVWL
jgi:2-methylaconitate cis-trans-isomerase PrpF